MPFGLAGAAAGAGAEGFSPPIDKSLPELDGVMDTPFVGKPDSLGIAKPFKPAGLGGAALTGTSLVELELLAELLLELPELPLLELLLLLLLLLPEDEELEEGLSESESASHEPASLF